MTIDKESAIISENDIALYDITRSDTKVIVMTSGDKANKYLPLTEATYYIMLSLVKPLHGYGVMKKVEAISQGTVKVGAGTLYGAFSNLEKEKLIVKVTEEDRRKCYALTPKGKQVLLAQIERLEIMNGNGLSVKDELMREDHG